MTKRLTTYLETTVNGLNTKEELVDIIELLKDINAKLVKSKYLENEIKCSLKVSDCTDLLRRGHVTTMNIELQSIVWFLLVTSKKVINCLLISSPEMSQIPLTSQHDGQ